MSIVSVDGEVMLHDVRSGRVRELARMAFRAAAS